MVEPLSIIAAALGGAKLAAEIAIKYLEWQERKTENRQKYLKYEAKVTCNVCGGTFSGLHGAAVHFGHMHKDIIDRG